MGFITWLIALLVGLGIGVFAGGPPPENNNASAPIYRCALNAEKNSDGTYSFSTAFTVENGVTVNNITYRFGDGTGQVDAPANEKIDHTFAVSGNYSITASLNVNVNGNIVMARGSDCRATVMIPA